jgi:hypothetical protein
MAMGSFDGFMRWAPECRRQPFMQDDKRKKSPLEYDPPRGHTEEE